MNRKQPTPPLPSGSSSSQTIRRLTLRAHVHSWSGYGVLSCELFHWLTQRDIFVSIRAMAMDEKFGSKIPLAMRAQLVHARQPEDWELLIHTPEQSPTPGRKTAFFTMFECTELAPSYAQMINRADIVIVPCVWNQTHFKESGITKPIFVVPLGIDPRIFTPTPIPSSGPCVFGVAGRTAHCAKRKGIQEVIDLFLQTFPKEDDVRLHVKIHDDCRIKEVTDPRIKVTRSHLEPYELANWISDLTAFVSLARAEGFGLWQLQAMACGRPVVACKYSGLADFLPADFAVPFKEVPADSGGSVVNVDYRGLWAQPDLRAAGSHLRRIYFARKNNDPSLAHAAKRAGDAAASFTWQKSADKLIAVLEGCGALSSKRKLCRNS